MPSGSSNIYCVFSPMLSFNTVKILNNVSKTKKSKLLSSKTGFAANLSQKE